MDAATYLQRIGWDRAVGTDSATLAALQRCHLEMVPFENFDIHLQRPIDLNLPQIYQKNRRATAGRSLLRTQWAVRMVAAGTRIPRTIRVGSRLVERAVGGMSSSI